MLQGVSIGTGVVVIKNIPLFEVWRGVSIKFIRKCNQKVDYEVKGAPILH